MKLDKPVFEPKQSELSVVDEPKCLHGCKSVRIDGFRCIPEAVCNFPAVRPVDESKNTTTREGILP